MTAEEFKASRLRLGLSVRQLAVILDTSPQSVTKWEAPPSASTSSKVNTIAAQAMRWMLAGFRPPEWPAEPAAGKPGNPRLRRKQAITPRSEAPETLRR